MSYEKTEKITLKPVDELAIKRTRLAEDRTYLSYIRTGMSLGLGGAFFIGHFKEGVFSYIGYFTVLIAMVFLGYGFYNHKKSMALIERLSMRLFGFKPNNK